MMSHFAKQGRVNIWKGEDLTRIRESNRLCAQVLHEVTQSIEPGIPTEELDRIAEKLVRSKGARPAFKGYHGYPASLCVSINEQVIHGIPGSRMVQPGDVVSVDMGVEYRGFYGDCSKTVPVGSVNDEVKELLKVTEHALMAGIDRARDGNRISDISHAIQITAESAGFSVVQDFVGHGIGRALHEPPQIPNYGPPGEGIILKSGMVFAIEPMVNIGDHRVRILSDGWTAVTWDSSCSAHFEHTVLVTGDGAEILTCP
jgi:methionyl aminopeptidase